MAFNRHNLDLVTKGLPDEPDIYEYRTNDTIATVTTAGYFGEGRFGRVFDSKPAPFINVYADEGFFNTQYDYAEGEAVALSGSGGGLTVDQISTLNEADSLFDSENGKSAAEIIGAVDKVKKAPRNSAKLITFFGNSFVSQPTGFVMPFALKARGLQVLANAGIGGNTSQMMLDRLDDIPAESNIVLVYESNNDSGASVTPEQHSANIKGIFKELQALGYEVVYLLASPTDDAGKSALTYEYRMRDWLTCRALDIKCFDVFSQFANNDGTGFWASGKSVDGTHPTRQTYGLAGVSLAYDYNNNNYAIPLQIRNDLGPLDNALMINDTNSDGLPNGFASNAIPALSLSETLLGIGNTLTMTNTDVLSFVRTDTIPMTIGKKYIVAVRFSCEFANTADGEIQIYMLGVNDSLRHYLLEACSVDIDNTTLYMELDATDSAGYRFYAAMNGTDYAATLNIAQITIFEVESNTTQETATYTIDSTVKTTG